MAAAEKREARLVRGPYGLPEHPLLPQILGEIHSRPFHPVETPRTIIQLAFLADRGDFSAHLASLSKLRERQGDVAPSDDTRHLTVERGKARLRWERHTEFTTWSYDAPATSDLHDPLKGHPFGDDFDPPGPLISAIRLDLLPFSEAPNVLAFFDPTSLSYSEMDNGAAIAASDFRQDGDGFTRIVVLDRNLGSMRAGALIKRLIEVETYRTLALLGLPEAQRLLPELDRIERELSRITAALNAGATESARLLEELTALSAKLEADTVATLYRFGASRAYDEIVTERLAILQESPIAGHETWHGFLRRRMAPAMRTCRTVTERLEKLSEKLARSSNLLRTRVDVELERQNRDLLQSMNRRAQLQLRLQRTVEGLSVAAVSYYVVGLVYYLVHGAKDAGVPLRADLITALWVPVVLLSVAWMVRRIRRRHVDQD